MFRSSLNSAATVLWQFKGTVLIQIVIITIGMLTRNQSPEAHRRLLAHVGADYELLRDGRLWHLLTGTWFQSEAGIAFSMILLVFTGTVFLEYLVGTGAMLLTCVTGDWVATIFTTLTLRVLSGMGVSTATALLVLPDSGTSALAHAGYGAVVMLLPRRWRRVAIPVLIVFTLAQFVFIALAPAIVHCWAALYGGLVGWFILRPRLDRNRQAAERETDLAAPPFFDNEAVPTPHE